MPVMRCDTRQSHLWIQQQHHQQQNEELLETATTTAYVSTKPIFRQRHFELEPEPEVEEDDVDSTTEEPQPDPEEMMADLSATTNNNSKGNSNKNLLLQQQQQNERHLSPKARMSAICERLKGGDVASGDVMTMSEYAVAIEPAVKRPWTDDDEGEDDHMSSGSFSGREDDVENGAAPVNFNRYHDDDDDVNSLCEDDDRNADDNGVGLHPLEGAAGSSDSGDDETHLARGMDVDDDEEEPEVDNQPPEDDDLDDEDERYRRDLLLAAGNRQRSTSRSSSPIEGNGQDSVGGFDDDEDNDVIDGTRGAAEYARFASGELKDDEDEVDDFEGRRDDGYFRSAALQSNAAAYRGQLLSTTTATDFRFDEPDVAAAPATEGSVEPSRSESRRNKRKNFKPRNIVYQFNVCDEPEFPDATGNDRHAPESAPPTDGYVWQSSFQREQQQQQVLSASPPAWSGQQVDCDQEPDVSHDVIAPRSRSPSVPPSASFVSRSRSPTPPTPTASRRGPSLPSLLASSLTAGETPPAAPDAQVAPRRGDSEQPLDLSDIATTTKRIFPGQHPSPRDGVGGKSASGRGHVEDRKVEQKRDQSGTIPVSAPPTSTPMDLTITRSPPEYVGMTSPVQGHAKGAGHHQQQQPSSKRSKEMHGGVDIMDLSRTYGHHHPLHLLHHNAAPGPMNTSALNDMEKFAGGVMTAARGVTGSPASMPFPISSSAGPGTTANRIATAQRRLSVSSATSTGRVGHPNSATLGGNPMAELTSSISASLLGLHHPHQQVAPPSSSTSGNAASVRAAAAAAAHAAAFEYMQQAVRDREDGLMIGGGPSGGPSGPGEATAMKDYAESTMKELLGLYGFGDMNPDAITKDVSMPNFAAGLGPSSSPLSTSLFKEHGKSSPVDYTRYVRRFSNATECGSNYCKDLNYREHFHCLDCNSRVFIKKEEMIRHFKWHKKRDESLQHGFLRYSPMDDCSEKFPNCSHNRKQTHYHCLKESCDKVYISTSDVQMHANYHRKDSAIIQEGFQRYRATEDCGTPGCIFAGQRTTHFHCRRQNCNYTFKNKADMEKHKSYHIKDEQLNRDGFKKFMKHEHCSFENCRFSRVCNHIHCIRPGCIYVLHSSGQLYSHKRKHERRENEMAYRKFKLAQSMMRTLGENQVLALKSMGEDYKSQEALANQMHGNLPMLHGSSGGLPVSMSGAPSDGLGGDNSTASYTEVLQRSLSKYTAFLTAGGQQLDPSMVHGLIPGAEHLSMMDMNPEMLKMRADDSWKKYLSRYTANDPCKPGCEFLYKDHYHCNAENCTMVFRSKDGVREHARNHEQQDQVTDAFYTTIDVGQSNCCPSDCPFQSKERHYHCGWQSCREIIVPADKPFRRLDHYKMHEYSHKLNLSKDPMTLTMSSVDGIFKRKRGRPPKNRVIEFPFTSGPSDFPQAIYTSFKLPKPNHHPQQPMMAMFDKNIFGGGASTGMHPSVSKSSPISPSDMMSSQLGLLTQNMMQAKAFTKLSQLQPHLQKHMGVASPPGGLSSRLAATSEDDSLDRQEFEEARRRQAGVGGVDGAMREEDRRGGASSDDSSSGGSSTHFTTHNRSSPSTDSMQSQSAHPAYSGAGMLHRGHPGMAAALASSEMLLQQHHHQLQHPHHSFPGMNQPPALPYGVAPHGNHGPTAEELRFSPLHRNGSCGPAEVEQRSSPRGGGGSTSESGGAPSPGNSLESEPGSPSARHHSMQGSLKRSLSTGMDVSGGGGMRLDDSMASSSSVESKKAKLAAGCLRMLKEESVPEGYVRFRFNEDCRYPHCGYREHQTHFHCTRSDCGYSFCDKTRFVQHTARHDRLDTLMGGDFQQFRANVPCGHSDCVYLTAAAAAMAGGGGNGGGAGSSNNKASHFHCLKCEFVCTDTNKVVAHRRQHQKMDSITANGFEKFTASQTCSAEGCSHNQRQTHYHCMKCQYAVLGLSQMSAHKYRHAE